MAKSLDVFISEPAEIDLQVFALWLSGCSTDEATSQRMSSEPAISREFHDCLALLRSETQDQFRTFHTLESYLQFPQLC